MEWVKTYAGREKYFKQKSVRDCVTRAIAIAMDCDYMAMYLLIKKYSYDRSPRDGVCDDYYEKLLKDLGWRKVNCANQGLRLGEDELPMGTLIVQIKGHLVTVKDGVLYDSWNSAEKRQKIQAYWVRKPFKYKSMAERREEKIKCYEDVIKETKALPETEERKRRIEYYYLEIERLRKEAELLR